LRGHRLQNHCFQVLSFVAMGAARFRLRRGGPSANERGQGARPNAAQRLETADVVRRPVTTRLQRTPVNPQPQLRNQQPRPFPLTTPTTRPLPPDTTPPTPPFPPPPATNTPPKHPPPTPPPQYPVKPNPPRPEQPTKAPRKLDLPTTYTLGTNRPPRRATTPHSPNRHLPPQSTAKRDLPDRTTRAPPFSPPTT